MSRTFTWTSATNGYWGTASWTQVSGTGGGPPFPLGSDDATIAATGSTAYCVTLGTGPGAPQTYGAANLTVNSADATLLFINTATSGSTLTISNSLLLQAGKIDLGNSHETLKISNGGKFTVNGERVWRMPDRS